MERMTSRKNPLITHIKKLQSHPRYRLESGDYLGDGLKLYTEAIQSKAPLHTVVTCDQTITIPEGVRAVYVPEDVMETISPMKTPQGVLFLGTAPSTTPPETLPKGRYLVLDGVQDAGNVGTLWRTANGLGCDGIFLLEGCAQPWSHKTVRSSMGACFRLPLYQSTVSEITLLATQSHLPLYTTALDPQSRRVDEVDLSSCMVVLGSEGQGVSQELLGSCHQTIYLPMSPGAESLNVAVAGGIILWEMQKKGESP